MFNHQTCKISPMHRIKTLNLLFFFQFRIDTFWAFHCKLYCSNSSNFLKPTMSDTHIQCIFRHDCHAIIIPKSPNESKSWKNN
ncbi:hypothetical protein E1A91_D10G122800v1 [Gossypium mustelinum]|uniref:Uncharacterized protein n=1 Tax=Gossypium mustelinum TaxID=34275 RepID=A0A5D2T994_GOSMU|nr:hypothetical protein E1A91_D10G122800v1 [Gossypium mustelinum]